MCGLRFVAVVHAHRGVIRSSGFGEAPTQASAAKSIHVGGEAGQMVVLRVTDGRLDMCGAGEVVCCRFSDSWACEEGCDDGRAVSDDNAGRRLGSAKFSLTSTQYGDCG